MKLQTALLFAALGHVTIGTPLLEGIDGRQIRAPQRRDGEQYLPIGKGDRFEGGTKVPQGIGSKPEDFQDASKLSLLSVSEIESALQSIEKEYPEKFKLSVAETTYEKRPIYYGVAGSDQPRVFLTSGMHAREREGPDIVIFLIADLLWADKHNTGLTYHTKTYDVSQVRQALKAGIAIIPSVNPDGINYDQTTSLCWRKNRRPFNDQQFGVDINRNFEVFWDYKRIFSPSGNFHMSENPSNDDYIGPSPLSEPETRSITNVFEKVTSLSWYIDLHSSLGRVLYSWGHDETQFDDPNMSFHNEKFDGQRAHRYDKYKEYMERDDFEAQKSAAERAVTAMESVAGPGKYMSHETVELYPTMGSTDEAMARYYNHTCGANRIHALTFEFGRRPSGNNRGLPFIDYCREIFYPDAKLYADNILHTSVGLMELLLNAAGKDGETKEYRCDETQEEVEQQQPSPSPCPL